MARWQPAPIVGGAYSDDSKPWSAQDCVNFIVTPAERGGTRSPGKLTCLPGYTTFCASMQEAPVRGLHDVEGLLLAVTGDTLYRIGTDGAATAIGTIPGVGRVSMAHNQITYGHEVMIANGQSGYVYNTYTGAFGQVTDDGFSGFTVCDFVDGYIAGTDPQGRFWAHGMLRQAGEFNTLDRYDSEAAPDRVLSLIVSHREVMILNQRTASFSINTGAATGTFQNSNGTEMDVGIASPWARARLDNTVYWLGHDGVVYRLEGHSPIRKSTGPIEQAISRCDMSKAFAFTFEDRGHKVFYLTFPDGQTWGYDVWTNEWHRRQSKDLNRWRIDALVKWNGVWIAGDFSNGKLYQLDWAVQSEAGEEMERRRISAVLHDNGNRVTVNAVKIEVDTGLGANSTPLPEPILSPLSISGDLPGGFVGDSGTYQYTASGGVLPHTFAISSGSLPPGATMDAAGLVTYEYTTDGVYAWTVSVTDAVGTVATLEDSATITPVILLLIGTPGSGSTTPAAQTSEDGATFTDIPRASLSARAACGYGGGQWVAISSTECSRSADLLAWSPSTYAGTAAAITAVAYGDGVWVAVGSSGSRFRSSDDAASFVSVYDADATYTCAAYGNGVWIFGVAGTVQGPYRYSVDGGLTTAKGSAVFGLQMDCALYANGLWVAGGREASSGTVGQIRTSTDPLTGWTSRVNDAPSAVVGVAYGNGVWVAVCTGGQVLTSTDAWATYTTQAFTVTSPVAGGIVFSGGKFFIYTGTQLSNSADGVTWASVTTGLAVARDIATNYGAAA